jgi:hypothetical protein
MTDDGSWSDYVADAGTDTSALSDVSSSMGGAVGAVDVGLEATDTGALTDEMTGDLSSAASNVDEAGSWQQWADGDLATAQSWQDDAAGHVQAANDWAAWGNADAAAEEMGAAQTSSDIGDDVAGTASTDLSIGADYLDTASTDVSSIGSDESE